MFGRDGKVFGDLITVAGLEARISNTFFLTVYFPGLCRIDVNTRSLSGLSILVWKPGAANACDIAETAANLVARALVPAAGGTSWSGTPQQPTQLALVGRGACELLAAGVESLGELANGQPAITGNSTTQRCGLERGKTEVWAWIMAVGDAEGRPGTEDALKRQLGSLAAWEKDTANTCTITTEVLPGHPLCVKIK